MERKAAGQQILFGLMLQLCLGLGKFSMILTIFFFYASDASQSGAEITGRQIMSASTNEGLVKRE